MERRRLEPEYFFEAGGSSHFPQVNLHLLRLHYHASWPSYQRNAVFKVFIHCKSFSVGTQSTKQLMQFGAEVVLEQLTIPWVTGWVSFYQYVVCWKHFITPVDNWSKVKDGQLSTEKQVRLAHMVRLLAPRIPRHSSCGKWLCQPRKVSWSSERIWNGICLYQVGVATASCPLTEPGYRR